MFRGKKAGNALQSLADYLEITDVLDKFPAHLSGGNSSVLLQRGR